jgi:hypothetical protein
VDRWPRVAATVAQAPGGLGESVRQHFEDGDSPGRCGGGGLKRWHPSAAEALWWSPAEEKRPVRLATRQGFLKNRERGERVTGAGKLTKNPRSCTVHHDGERFESAWLTASGGEDVHRRPKGVGVLQFGCSEGVERWRGGLPSGAQLGGNGGRALGRLEPKLRERRMGGEWHHAAGDRTEWRGRSANRARGRWRWAATVPLC